MASDVSGGVQTTKFRDRARIVMMVKKLAKFDPSRSFLLILAIQHSLTRQRPIFGPERQKGKIGGTNAEFTCHKRIPLNLNPSDCTVSPTTIDESEKRSETTKCV